MPQEIADQLARLNELTAAELTKLQNDIVKEFDKIDKNKNKTPADVELLEQLAGANDAVNAEVTTRQQASEAAEERAAELRNKMHPGDGDPADGDPADGDPAAPADGTDPAEVDPAQPVLPIAAGAGDPPARPLPTIAELNAGKPALRPGAQGGVRAKARTVAQFNSRGLALGDKIESREQFDELMYDKVFAMGRVKGTGEKQVVASIYTEYPDERKLGQDPAENEAKIKAVTSREAITASGGICGPVAVDYDILILSSTDEPLGDSLPKFNADRGGVRYILPPTFVGVGTSATGIWTAATDLNPGAATKPLQTIACASVVETLVDAVATRLKFGNMQGRFFPELIAANTDLALANAARVKEVNRLTKIAASSTLVSSSQLLGASRDLLATLDQACAALRYRSRIDRGIRLRTIFPDWAKDLLRADFTRELAHAQEVDWNSLSVSDEQLEGLLDRRGVNVTWMLDGQATVTGNNPASFQGWGAQAPGAALNAWPTNLVWWLFPEGTFQLLDGGQMDFGVIRDSVLDATNDYEIMIEVFENVIYRGFESLEVVSTVKANGSSAAGMLDAPVVVY